MLILWELRGKWEKKLNKLKKKNDKNSAVLYKVNKYHKEDNFSTKGKT